MNKIANKLFASSFIKSIFQLTMGSFIAQIITVIASPILTRLYTPEQIGIYTLIITISAMFGPVICGKYDLAIVSAKDEKEVMELILGSIIFSTTFLLLITIGYNFYLVKNPEIVAEVGVFAYLLIVILLFIAFINILTSYNNRHKEYKLISTVYVVRTLVQNIGLIGFGLIKLGAIGLLVAQFLGSLFGVKKQSEHLYKNRSSLKKVRFNGIKNTLIKYRKQPLYSMPAHFINSTSYSLLNFFISGLFGMGVFGYYSMSYRILGLPLGLISMNVSKVFFQRASEEKQKTGSFTRTLKHTTLILACFSIPMVIVLILLGPFLFELVFGTGWEKSGVFVQILAPMYGVRLIVSALTPAFIVTGKQKLEIVMQSIFIISSIGSYVGCKVLDLDIYSFLYLITITYSIIYILFYIIIYKLSKKTS